MNAIGASIITVLVLVVLLAPRRAALLGMMAGVLYLTFVQQVKVLGFNMFAIRFLELAGFFRVMARGEFSFARLNKIDRNLLFLYGFSTLVYTLRSTEGLAYVIGTAVDACLCYFTFRGLIVDTEDFEHFLYSFVVMLTPYAMLIISEMLTHHNPFAFIGAGMFDWVRNGRFRCVGTFRNPDLLGTLGASFLPLYVGLVHRKERRMQAILGIGLCLLIVWASNSGGPVCTAGIALAGWGCWYVRTRMRLVRWSIVGTLVVLALMMKAPVWYLLARVSAITGGDGWHRAYLMDVSYRHLSEWWLIGMPIINTADWFPYFQASNGGGADITNTFIAFGLTAGLGAVALFILLLAQAFGALGKALAVVRGAGGHKPSEAEFMMWSLGAMLMAHVANWLGITYFDQTYMVWFMQLAAISSLSESCLEPGAKIETDEPEGWAEENVFYEPEVQYEKELP